VLLSTGWEEWRRNNIFLRVRTTKKAAAKVS